MAVVLAGCAAAPLKPAVEPLALESEAPAQCAGPSPSSQAGVRGQQVRRRVDRSRRRCWRGLPDRLRHGPRQGRHRLEPRTGHLLPAGPRGVYNARGSQLTQASCVGRQLSIRYPGAV
jgi:hypothetical protein